MRRVRMNDAEVDEVDEVHDGYDGYHFFSFFLFGMDCTGWCLVGFSWGLNVSYL
jgi:hypothetical protein